VDGIAIGATIAFADAQERQVMDGERIILFVDLRSKAGTTTLESKSGSFRRFVNPVATEEVRSLCQEVDQIFRNGTADLMDARMRATGLRLWALLINDEMQTTLRGIVTQVPVGLVCEHFESDELAWQVPVEWLNDLQIGVISLHKNVTFSRGLSGLVGRRPLETIADRPVVLFSWAASHDSTKTRLDLLSERAFAETTLKLHRADSVVIHRQCASATCKSLQTLLYRQHRKHEPVEAWVHCGHGQFVPHTGKSRLLLHDDLDGTEDEVPLTGEQMEQAGLFKDAMRLVFFNVCHSARAGGLLRSALSAGVPAALGHTRAVDDQAAIEFSKNFWLELQRGTIASATAFARRSIERILVDWGLPVLYLADPNMTLFTGRRQIPA
jgi:hypothetical protein